MNYQEWSSATPGARGAAIWEMRKAGLAEKRRLEREGLLPDYDYPDAKGTLRSSGQKRRPITVLNDNPGPCYGIETPWRRGVSISGRCVDRNRVMLIDGDDLKSNVKNYNDGGHASSLPVATTPGWNENKHRKESVYQSTHNTQALTDKKLKPESRIALRKPNLSSENGRKCEGTVDPSTERMLPSVKADSEAPGPGSYQPLYYQPSPAFSISGRLRPSLNDNRLQVTDAGVVVHQ